MNALIVEDFKPIAEMWEMLLSRENFEGIKITDNASEALQLAENLNPDIILLDINIAGGVDGIQCAIQLLNQNKDLKILFLSLHSQENVVLKALRTGAKGYCVKNSSINEITEAIRTIVNGGNYIGKNIQHFLDSK